MGFHAFFRHSFYKQNNAFKSKRDISVLMTYPFKTEKMAIQCYFTKSRKYSYKSWQSVTTRGYCQRNHTKESRTVETFIDIHKCSHDKYNLKETIGEFIQRSETRRWCQSFLPLFSGRGLAAETKLSQVLINEGSLFEIVTTSTFSTVQNKLEE